jgi:hypothetical protein
VIPPGGRVTDDPKSRPHFLANRCDPASDPDGLATLAHMSTRNTEAARYGCPSHEIVPREVSRQPHHPRSFVVAARLVPQLPDQLQASLASAFRDVEGVRAAILRAIAPGDAMKQPPGSVRGRLVRVLDSRADFRYGVLVTEGRYSAQRRYQLVVPVIDRVVTGVSGPEILEPVRWDVQPRRAYAWMKSIPLQQPMFDTAGLIALTEPWRHGSDRRTWLARQIEVLDVAVDADTLSAILARIIERLQL